MARPSLLAVVWMVKNGESVVSKVISGADFAAPHATSPHHASHPMRVILDLDEKLGVLSADYFLPRRFAAYPSLLFFFGNQKVN